MVPVVHYMYFCICPSVPCSEGGNINNVFCVPCAGDGIPTADFCNGSMTTFSDTASFLPGQNVTIACSLPNNFMIWSSPQFTSDTLVVSDTPILGVTSGTRLDGAIIFTLTNVIAGPPPCYTATATIANIQESMQGLNLTCTDGMYVANLIIDVIGKLHVVHVCTFLSFMM